MPTLTISDIDESLEVRLRQWAEANGHAPEEEARLILRAALSPEPDTLVDAPGNLAQAIRAAFAPFGGVDDIDFEWMRKLPNTREPPSFD